MSGSRVIGTTNEAIEKAEEELGFSFSPSFREWLLTDNGKAIEDVTIFPIFDDRDPRKTWDSIVRNFNQNWKLWLDNYGEAFDFSYLLPFGEFGTGDYFCFDYSDIEQGGEAPVVVWLHETGRTKLLASDFAEFVKMAAKGDLDY